MVKSLCIAKTAKGIPCTRGADVGKYCTQHATIKLHGNKNFDYKQK